MDTLSYMALQALHDATDIFTHADATALGISDRRLAAMCRSGELDRLARGIYLKPHVDVDHNLAEIAIRSPKATLCLTTALAHHDLTDDIPPSINVALPRQQRSPRTAAPVTWHRFDNATFGIGQTRIALTNELSIGLYDPTRTIIDTYRLRHLYGSDQAHGALKRWLRQSGNQPATLLTMAKQFPKAEQPIRTALEILL